MSDLPLGLRPSEGTCGCLMHGSARRARWTQALAGLGGIHAWCEPTAGPTGSRPGAGGELVGADDGCMCWALDGSTQQTCKLHASSNISGLNLHMRRQVSTIIASVRPLTTLCAMRRSVVLYYVKIMSSADDIYPSRLATCSIGSRRLLELCMLDTIFTLLPHLLRRWARVRC